MIPIIRTAQVKGKVLKGKDNVPTLVLKGYNGEKWELPLNDTVHLETFLINQEIRVRFEDIPHRSFDEETPQEPCVTEPKVTEPALPVEQPDPDDNQAFIEQVPESSATIPEGECPKGVFQNEYGTSEVCDDCKHLVREGNEELGMGDVVCNLDPKPKQEEPVPEQESIS